MKEIIRCHWAGDDPLYVAYHDEEWGVPIKDARLLFEFLILEGFQAGLSWLTILKKRENFRRAFDGFDPAKIARYTARKHERLMNDPGIIRNRLKIESASRSAKAFLSLEKEPGGFSRYIWSFIGGKPRQNSFDGRHPVPAETPESKAMSKDLKSRGFNFVGATICYAFMQATGVVNDHVTACFRHEQLLGPATGETRSRSGGRSLR
jgi:DNA-3-methyladenine glycosylase I